MKSGTCNWSSAKQQGHNPKDTKATQIWAGIQEMELNNRRSALRESRRSSTRIARSFCQRLEDGFEMLHPDNGNDPA